MSLLFASGSRLHLMEAVILCGDVSSELEVYPGQHRGEGVVWRCGETQRHGRGGSILSPVAICHAEGAQGIWAKGTWFVIFCLGKSRNPEMNQRAALSRSKITKFGVRYCLPGSMRICDGGWGILWWGCGGLVLGLG